MVNSSTDTPYNQSIALLIACLFIGAGFWFVFYHAIQESGLHLLYVLIFIQLSPLILCLFTQKINYLALILGSHCATYSIPRLNSVLYFQEEAILSHSAEVAVIEVIKCTLLIMMVYFIVRSMIGGVQKAKSFEIESLPISRRILIFFGTLILLSPFVNVPQQVRLFEVYLVNLGMVMLLTVRAPGSERLLLFFQSAMIFASIVNFLKFGFLRPFGLVAAVIFVAFMIQRKRSQMLMMIAVVFTLSYIQPIKGEYRHYLDKNRGTTLMAKAKYLWELMQEDPKIEQPISGDSALKNRLIVGSLRSGDVSLETVLTNTPSKVPFWEGRTLQRTLYIFIPRFMWEDKPSTMFYNEFGRVYGILSSDDRYTSVGFSFLAEGYMNFGFMGLYSFAFLFAIAIALTEKISYTIWKRPFTLSYIMCSLPYMWYSLDATSMIIGLTLTLTIMTLIRRVFINNDMIMDAYGRAETRV